MAKKQQKMKPDVSGNTIMVLMIAAIIISVLAITLSMIAVNKVSTMGHGSEVKQPLQSGGVVSAEVPTQPSESGAQVSVNVQNAS